VAANPTDFGPVRSSDPYVEIGGSDWKPFFPRCKRRVHEMLQNFVSSDELGFTSDEMAFSGGLVEAIQEALDRRQIVIILVDGWSISWGSEYRNVLKRLDQRLDYHWCVLVPWNDDDADSVTNREKIRQAIVETFDRHAVLAPNPLFFRSEIKSPDELQAAVRDVLTRLKEEVKKRAPVAMPVPSGPNRVMIVGPSA